MKVTNTQFLLFTMCLNKGWWMNWSQWKYKFDVCKDITYKSKLGIFYVVWSGIKNMNKM